MVYILLALLLLQIAALIAGGLIARRLISAGKSQIYDFFESDSSGGSPAARVVDMTGQIIGKHVANQMKMLIMNQLSQDSRHEARVIQDLNQDRIESESPMLNQLLQLSPSLKKSVGKSPALADFLLSRIMNMSGGGNHAKQGVNVEPPAFNL